MNFSINVSIRWIGFRNSFSSVLTKTEILVYKLWSIFSNYKKFRSNEFWSIFENSKILVNQFRLIIGKMDQKRYTKVLAKKKPMSQPHRNVVKFFIVKSEIRKFKSGIPFEKVSENLLPGKASRPLRNIRTFPKKCNQKSIISVSKT